MVSLHPECADNLTPETWQQVLASEESLEGKCVICGQVERRVTAYDFLKMLRDDWCHFQTREGGVGVASNSELRRWCLNGAVVINGKRVRPTDEITFPIMSMVLFPNHPVTLC